MVQCCPVALLLPLEEAAYGSGNTDLPTVICRVIITGAYPTVAEPLPPSFENNSGNRNHPNGHRYERRKKWEC